MAMLDLGPCAQCCGPNGVVVMCCPTVTLPLTLFLTWSAWIPITCPLIGATLVWDNTLVGWAGTDISVTCPLQYLFRCFPGGFWALSILSCAYSNISTGFQCTPTFQFQEVAGSLGGCCLGCVQATFTITP
jgi:hypothetical protein